MTTWTSDALQALEGYLENNRGRVASNGADADEVVADLRRHVEEEVAALELPVVTHDDVQRIVSRIGPVPAEEPPAQSLSGRLAPVWPSGILRSGSVLAMLFFGVLLPLVTIGFELVTRLCAGTFFDPLPTTLHLVLVALVPLANAAAWWSVYMRKGVVGRGLWWLNGAAFGVSLFYSVLFLPLSPFALIGIVYLGFGLLPLAPLCACICAWRLRIRLLRECQAGLPHRERARVMLSSRSSSAIAENRVLPYLAGNGRANGDSGRHDALQIDGDDGVQEDHSPMASLRGWGWSAGLSAALLGLLALPGPLTRYYLDRTASESPETSAQAVRWLRLFGSKASLLKECYGRGNRLWIEVFGGRPPNPELAQKAFYRVTGKPYNAYPPPLSKFQKAGRDLFGEFEWDAGLGGDTVAGQVRGLSLAASRLDGLCQPDEAWSYLEWTLEFENSHPSRQREARAQIQLPPGGVVSRLTLWVNGEEREAAFAGRSKVREAYRTVAVEQRRDPVLVTTSGPDRVLVQCFPVPPGGGKMKVRLGITAPLIIESATQAALKLPSILERNFAVTESVRHSLWLESPLEPQSQLAGVVLGPSTPGKPVIRGDIADAQLSSADAILRFPLSAKATLVRARDRKGNSGAIIKQTIESAAARMPARVAIVLDGSEDMTKVFPQIARALDGLPTQPELTVWFAQDGVRQIFSSAWAKAEPVSAVVGKLRGIGGQDDLPALLQAWEWAAAKQNSVVLWVHGPQPVLLGSIEPLRQRLEWRSNGTGPEVVEASISPGPNRIVEQLGSLNAIRSLTRLDELRDDLERLFATWSGRRQELRIIRELETDPVRTDPQAQPPGSFHVVRLWARDRIQLLAKARRVSEAVQLAALYQLVTDVSGAVVLQTKQQFAAVGLSPVEPLSVPAVPEPSVWLLLAVGACLTFLWGRRSMRGSPPGS